MCACIFTTPTEPGVRIQSLKDGKVLVEGDPEEVITEESIRELYGIELGVTRVDGRKFVLAV